MQENDSFQPSRETARSRSIPDEVYLIFDALSQLHATSSLSAEDESLPVIAGPAGPIKPVSDQKSGLTLKDLLSVRSLDVAEIGALTLWAHGFSSDQAVLFTGGHYELIGYESVAGYFGALAQGIVKIINASPDAKTILGDLEVSARRSRPVLDMRRPRTRRLPGQKPGATRIISRPVVLKWHEEAVRAYINGSAVNEIAQAHEKSRRGVTGAFDRLVVRLGRLPESERPDYYDALVEKRKQVTHGGDRGGNQYARWELED